MFIEPLPVKLMHIDLLEQCRRSKLSKNRDMALAIIRTRPGLEPPAASPSACWHRPSLVAGTQ
jgi:hypothetical protein